MRPVACAVVVTFLAVALPGRRGLAEEVSGGAQQTSEFLEAQRIAARTALIEGVKLLDRNLYADALIKFDQAYALVPSAKIQYNRGLAQVGLDDAAAAVDAFDQFLRDAPEAPPANRASAESWVRKLAGRIGYVNVTSDVADARVLVDGEVRAVLAAGVARAVPVRPGVRQVICDAGHGQVQHSLSITVARGEQVALQCKVPTLAAIPTAAAVAPGTSAAGAPASRAREGTGAGVIALSLDQNVAAARATAAPQSPSQVGGLAAPPSTASHLADAIETPIYKRWWFWTGMGVVLAAAVVTTVLIVRGNQGAANCGPDVVICTGAN